jgi:hypothetical protein
MRTQEGLRNDLPVHETGEIVELTMTLVVGSDPIRGSTRVAGGEQREFWGWLELAEIVQHMADGGVSATNGQLAPTPCEGVPSR